MVSATTGNAKRRKTEGLPSNGLQIRGNEDAGANADEDFEIIGGDVGQVALRDLPHLRPDCVDHKMSTGNSAANMEHCPQCYCYVCDVKVSSCTMWGNGSADRDHCNACKSFSWDRLRNLARIGKMALVQEAYASAGIGPVCPAAAPKHMSQTRLNPAAFKSSSADRPRKSYATNAKAPAARLASKPTLPAGVVPLPDPAGDPNALELGKVSLRVKTAKKTMTIAELLPRLERTGFYMRKDSLPSSVTSGYGDRLFLSNIFETNLAHVYRGSQNDSGFLKFTDDPQTNDPQPTTDQRVRQVTVVDSLGRVPPVVLGVKVHKSARPDVIVSALQPMLQPPPDPSEELLLTVANQPGQGESSPRLIKDSDMGDGLYKTQHLYLYRLPKMSIEAGAAAGPRSEEAGPRVSGPLPFTLGRSTPPTYVSILLRQSITRPASNFRRRDRMDPLMRMMYGFDDDDDDDDDEFSDEDDVDAYFGGCYYSMRGPITEIKGIGMPILLPIAEKHCRSGEEANQAISEALERALRPFRKPPSADQPEASSSSTPASKVKLFRGQIYSSMNDRDSYKQPGKVLDGMAALSEIALMTALWTADDASALYDFELLEKPAVDPSASKEALAETVEVMEIERTREHDRKRRSAHRWELLEELKLASARIYTESNAPGSTTVAVTMDLTPASATKPRHGMVTLTVYAWVKDASGVRSLFQSWDNWGLVTRLSDFPLKRTMKFLLQDVVGAKAMWQQLEDMNKAVSSCNDVRSVNGVLKLMQSGERPAATQPAGLTVQMRQYQLQSLQFMLDAEAQDGGFRSLFWLQKSTPQGRKFWYSPVLGRACLHVPEQSAGGFLAEEMGLGKTVEVLALILAAQPPASVIGGVPHVSASGVRVVTRATLVVCAVSLVGQWVEEARSKSAGGLRILQYHGQGRQRDIQKIASNYDLVVTTYQTLGSDYCKDGKSEMYAPLGQIHWFRIVFDEGHMVKTVAAQQSKASVLLSSDRRWCCTGTPIGTSIEELLGQFAAINMAPLNTKVFFDTYIKPAFGWSRSYGSESSPATLLYTLKASMIRHTKQQVLGGEVVLQLPPKTQEDIAVTLSAPEQELYRKVFAKVQEKWFSFRAGGAASVTKYQLTIMSMLGPLRRICSGGALHEEDLNVPDLEPEGLLKSGHAAVNLTPDTALVSTEMECSICLDMMENPVVTPCSHWFCRECITSWLDQKDTCSLCRTKITVGKLRRGVMPGYQPPAEGDEADDSAGPSEPVIHNCESKLQALLSELRMMRSADATAKALVFSQYNTTLEWLKKRLSEEGFGYRTISGSMPLKQRTKAIEAFQKDPPTTVFLLSMRSGAVGINLTAASHVFIMEPCLNPALEEQAIGRSWRMGQKRSVVVKRFYTKGSIEDSIIKVVQSRREAGARLVGATEGSEADDAAITAAAQALLNEQGSRRRGGLNRAIAEVVAGNIRSDKQSLKMNELEQLFSPPTFTADPAPAASAAPGVTPSGTGPAAAATAEMPAPGPSTDATQQAAHAGGEAAGPGPAAAGVPGPAPPQTANAPQAAGTSGPPPVPSAPPQQPQTEPTAASGVLLPAPLGSTLPATTSAVPTPVAAAAVTPQPERSSLRARKVANYADMLKG